MNNSSIYIGLDPGQKTGMALWNPHTKKLELHTFCFWEAIDQLKFLCELYNNRLKVFVEDPNLNRTTFQREDQNEPAMRRISRNVGKNQRDAQLIIEWLFRNGVKYYAVKPGKNSMTKLSAEAFKKLTGYKGRCSQHARDAGILIYGR